MVAVPRLARYGIDRFDYSKFHDVEPLEAETE